MQFADLERAISSLIRLAFYPLILVVACWLIVTLLTALPPLAVLGLVCLLAVLSPAAYLVRQNLTGQTRRQGARRGAERTPVVPLVEEDNE